jgi:Ca2+-binding RTX toxin-like protein
MRALTINTIRLLGTSIAILALATTAMAQPADVTFDDGMEGWDPNPDCTAILDDGAEHGNYLNFTNVCDDTGFLRGWFNMYNNTNEAFVGDYTAKGPVRISFDMSVEFYDFLTFNGWLAVEEYRDVVVELIDFDDPAPGYPWTSVYFNVGFLPARDSGWRTFVADVVDVNSTELPAGWGGTGAEDPVTYMPTLPAHRTWTDVLAGVDEIRITSLVPGYFYSLDFLHSINVDNLSIGAIPQSCNGLDATVYVDDDGIVHGGEFDGMPYDGELYGTEGPDVINGTAGRDDIAGYGGDDIICGNGGDDHVNGHDGVDFILGGEGDDNLIGHKGDDFIDAGDGRDHINGGQGEDTCLHGEVVNQCDGMPGIPKAKVTSKVTETRTGAATLQLD